MDKDLEGKIDLYFQKHYLAFQHYKLSYQGWQRVSSAASFQTFFCPICQIESLPIIVCSTCNFSVCSCGYCNCVVSSTIFKNTTEKRVKNETSSEAFKKKITRNSHCYSCQRAVDNSIHKECTSCGWIKCQSCNACGCGYSKNYSY
jgi:hypothetical protein